MSRPMFLVVRRALKEDGRSCDDQYGQDTGSRVPVRLFASRAAADACASALLAAARSTVCPFTQICGYVSDDEAARLVALGFPVECPDDSWHEEWRLWWDMCQDLITDEQRAAVWAVLAETPPFEVCEIEVGDE